MTNHISHAGNANASGTTHSEQSAGNLADQPRIAPLNVAELSDDLLLMLGRMIELNTAMASRQQEILHGLTPGAADFSTADLASKLANLPEIMRTMLRHPQLFARQVEVGIQLLTSGALPARERELAILRVAWLCRAPYEWGEHVHIAKKLGVTSEQIERVTQGSAASGWSALEKGMLCAVEELHADAVISDPTWAQLAQLLDERQLIELPILIGQYQTVAYYQNSLRLRLHEGNLGLDAR